MSSTLAERGGALPDTVVEAFRAAIDLAASFQGATAPNPPVGCAILDRDGRLLAVSAHRKAGEDHAEAAALALCKRDGKTGEIDSIVVTLEPCNHWGRTPPCTEAILQTPARTLWIGATDPNPRVPGGGVTRLREAGLAVHVLDAAGPDVVAQSIAARCRDLVAPFAKRALTGRPWITIKQALDAAGSMIPPPGCKTFTSAAALTLAHRMRKRADAIMTGSGTILADDPAFTVRLVPDHPGRRRQLVILDRRGRVPQSYLTAAETRGFQVRVEQDLNASLDVLGQEGVLEILVEAGPALTASLLDAGLWDEHLVIRRGGLGESDSATARSRQDGSLRDIAMADR